MLLNAKIEVQERLNKEGKPYQMFVVKYEDKQTGELLTIYEAYMRPSLLELLTYLHKKDKSTK